MGAELIGSILIGPTKLDPDDVKTARIRLRKLKHQLDSFMTLTKDMGEDDVQWKDALGSDRFAILRPVLNRVRLIEGVSSEQVAIEALAGFFDTHSPARFMRDFAAFWNRGFRDVMEREFIDPTTGATNAHFKIVVTGTVSWGDGFEEGDGGWLVTRADWLGIFDILGIQ